MSSPFFSRGMDKFRKKMAHFHQKTSAVLGQKYPCLVTEALKALIPLSYVCETGFSSMVTIKNKASCLWRIICGWSGYFPSLSQHKYINCCQNKEKCLIQEFCKKYLMCYYSNIIIVCAKINVGLAQVSFF